MHEDFHTDKEYGYCVELSNTRPLPIGHKIGFTSEDTEVTAIQKIFNAYFNTESIESLIHFSEYKLEFALTVIDALYLVAKNILDEGNKQFNELEMQLTDIAHKMTKNKIEGYNFSKSEKVEIFDTQQDLYNKRRLLKDTLSILRVIIDNMEKTRNFILGMNRRNFTPKSQRFKDDDGFALRSKEHEDLGVTTVYVQPTPISSMPKGAFKR